MPTSLPTSGPTASPQATKTISAAGGLGKVAYVLDGDIYTVDLLSGSPQRLTTDGTMPHPSGRPPAIGSSSAA